MYRHQYHPLTMIEIEICLFNSLAKYAPASSPLRLSIPLGTKASQIVRNLQIPPHEIYVAWRNGHNIMTTFGGEVEENVRMENGDRLALSGPIPFSRAYGAPVC
jgi:hypothetical protein